MSRNYRSSRYRSSHSSGSGSRWMDLRYAGTCKVCGVGIAAGTRGFWDAAAKTVTCTKLDCADVDGLTTSKPLTGPWDTRTDTRVLSPTRIGPAAPTDPFAKTRSRADTTVGMLGVARTHRAADAVTR